MKILKSKKMLLSLVCALVLVFGSCMTVCADSFSDMSAYTYPSCPDGFKYVFFRDADSDSAGLIYYTGEIFTQINSSSGKEYICTSGEYYLYSSYRDTYNLQEQAHATMDCREWYPADGSWVVLGSSVDIVLLDGSIFFQCPVLLTTVQMMEPEVMNPLVQILGLMPLLIPCLVGLVALRKGLQALWGHLHKA